MSTESVFEQTRTAARDRGLDVVALPPFLDVDTPDDLAAFRLEFMDRPDTAHWATQRALLPTLHCRDARGDQITPDRSVSRARPRQ